MGVPGVRMGPDLGWVSGPRLEIDPDFWGFPGGKDGSRSGMGLGTQTSN